jgi:hypothetical protein
MTIACLPLEIYLSRFIIENELEPIFSEHVLMFITNPRFAEFIDLLIIYGSFISKTTTVFTRKSIEKVL